MTSAGNITEDLCKICDGRVECAPTALLLISLIQTLYGNITQEPDYFGKNREELLKSEEKFGVKLDELPKEILESYKKHEEDAPNDTNFDVYDFVIIGGGTAGCVLASRLSENKKWKVLLLEAGPEAPKMSLVPGLANEFHGSALDWQYSMRPKKGFCQNRAERGCEVIQGRVLGGTSSINDMAYVRGSPADYDEWALNDNRGWGFDQVLPYFKYSEGNYDKDISKNKLFHSTQGPLDIGRYPYVDDNIDILLSAFNEIGYNYTDINGKNQLGFMRVQTMSYFGERVSSYTAFIEPIRGDRNNLDIITQALVTRVMLEEDRDMFRAIGVNYIKNGSRHTARATKEVILSAGALNSPKILMQSGIGPKDYLEYLGIKYYLDLPVGANFQDHVSVCLPVIKLTKTATNSKFPDKLKDITTYYTKGIGPLSANFQVIAFLETSLSNVVGAPNIEIRFKGHDSHMYYDTIDLCVSLLTPKSRGLIVLNATDPIYGNPLIYPNFLKDTVDMKNILEGIQFAVKVFDTEVFQTAGVKFDAHAMLNNECKEYENVTEDFWACIIRHFSSPLHNYAGTCKMGPAKDPAAIVDSSLRVYGVTNLRVIDASIMPKITRGSTAAPVIMIAEKGSDFIKTFWY